MSAEPRRRRESSSSDESVDLHRPSDSARSSTNRSGSLYVRQVTCGDGDFESRPVVQAGGALVAAAPSVHCVNCQTASAAGTLVSVDRRAARKMSQSSGAVGRTSRQGSRAQSVVSLGEPSDRALTRYEGGNARSTSVETPSRPPAQSSVAERPRKKRPAPRWDYKLAIFKWIEQSERQTLWYIGRIIGTYKFVLLVLPLLLFGISLVGAIVNREHWSIRVPFDSFYADRSAPVDEDRFVFQLEFNRSNAVYNALRRNAATDLSLIMTTKRGHSMLDEDAIDKYLTIKGALEALVVGADERRRDYAALCAEDCGRENVISLLMHSATSVALTYPESYVPAGKDNVSRLFLGSTLGGVQTDPDGAIALARSLALNIRLRDAADASDLSLWDGAFVAKLQDVAANDSTAIPIAYTWWSQESLLTDASDTVVSLLYGLRYSAAILLAVLVLFSFSKDAYTSKPGVGLSIAVAIALCCLGAVGCQISLTAYLNSYVWIAFFPISALAILLFFSLLQAWRKYNNVAVHPTEKIEFVLSWDGPVTLASLLSAVVASALVAAATTIPFFRHAFLLSVFAYMLLVVFAFLFFAVVLYLTGMREAAGVKWYRFWRRGDTHFPLPLTRHYDEKDQAVLHGKLCDNEPTAARAIGAAVAKVHMRFTALLVFSIYIIFAVWGCTVLPIELRETDFIGQTSATAAFLDAHADHFGKYEQYVELVFDDVLDYNAPVTQKRIFALLDWAQEEQYAVRATSWLQDFLRFEQSSIYLVNDDTFVPVVNLVFLSTEPYTRHRADVLFDKYHSQIIRSRMYLELSRLGVSNSLELINGLQRRGADAGLPLQVRAPYLFLPQHDVQLWPAHVVALSLLTVALAAVALVLLAEPLSALLSVGVCASVHVGALGFASLWHVPLNALTSAVALLSLPYTAAACFHFCYHFVNAGPRSGRSSAARCEYAFLSSVVPIFYSSALPLLAALPLLDVDAPVAVHIVKLFALQQLFTLTHLLLFLPPVLLLFVENAPTVCSLIKEVCDDTCCVCCDPDEDAASIYYMPTSGKAVDPDTLRRFFNSRYKDNMSISDHYALPPPPRREMLMPPPPPRTASYYPPDLIPPPRRRSHAPMRDSSVGGREHSRSGTPEGARGQRVGQREPGSPRVTSPPPTRRSFAMQCDDGKSVEESIYEEPPASVGDSASVYVVEKQANGGHRMVPERRARDGKIRVARWSHDLPIDPYHSQRVTTETYTIDVDDMLPDERIGLRPNWRQYLLDGAMRQPPPPALMPFVPPPPPPPPPPPMMYNMQRARGLPRMH